MVLLRGIGHGCVLKASTPFMMNHSLMKQTLLFSWEDNSKVSLSFFRTKSLSSDEPHPPVTYSTNRRSISMMKKMRRREDRDPTSSQAFSSTPTQRKMTSVIQRRLFEEINEKQLIS